MWRQRKVSRTGRIIKTTSVSIRQVSPPFIFTEHIMIALEPILTAPIAIQIHIVSAMTALALVPPVLWRARRDRMHKVLGYIWITAMVVTAVSSFWITEVRGSGRFSPLHLLAILSLVTMCLAIVFAIKGNIEGHKIALRNLSTFGLGIPSVLNFLPGRRISDTFFVSAPMVGLALSGGLILAILIWRSGLLGKAIKAVKVRAKGMTAQV
jgi:uncharacterized membrane protein